MLTSTSKPELRSLLRDRRKALSEAMRARASLAVANHLQSLPAWTRTRHLALYLPADGEIETAALAGQAREAGMSLYLPVVGNDGVMQFALWEQGAPLQENRYGIPQPGPQYPLYPVHDLDVVLMPLVGWSKSGARLGMGGGFYDRALAGDKGPVRIGLGFECQQVQHLPTEDWDVPMDFVATEAALHCCGEES